MATPMIAKVRETNDIESRIASAFIMPVKESAMSPKRKTKEGKPSPHKMDEVNPIVISNLSVGSARDHRILL